MAIVRDVHKCSTNKMIQLQIIFIHESIYPFGGPLYPYKPLPQKALYNYPLQISETHKPNVTNNTNCKISQTQNHKTNIKHANQHIKYNPHQKKIKRTNLAHQNKSKRTKPENWVQQRTHVEEKGPKEMVHVEKLERELAKKPGYASLFDLL
jgi:hypothetical protein